MTQKELNVLFSITIMIHEHEYFRGQQPKLNWFQRQLVKFLPKSLFHVRRDREETQDWVRKQLADNDIYTLPVGMSWGSLVSKELYDEYVAES